MNIEEIRLYCLSKPQTTECLPFDEWTLVIKVCGKMFMLLPLDNPVMVSMKCNPDYALELREQYEGIQPAFHFNKRYWNQVRLQSDVSDALLRKLIDHSYDEVVAKLPKHTRETLTGK